MPRNSIGRVASPLIKPYRKGRLGPKTADDASRDIWGLRSKYIQSTLSSFRIAPPAITAPVLLLIIALIPY